MAKRHRNGFAPDPSATRPSATRPSRSPGSTRPEPLAPRRDSRKNLRKLVGILHSLEHLATEWADASLALAVVQARRQGLADPRFLFEIYHVLAELASSESALSLVAYEWLDEYQSRATAKDVAEAVAVDLAGRRHMVELADLLASVSGLIKAAARVPTEAAAS